MTKKRINNRFLRILKYPVYIFILWIFIHSFVITIDGLSDDIKKSDVAIVLGSKVNENGTPSERLKARLDMAFQIFEEGMVGYIIVSGGIGKEGYDEALVMESYLKERGITEERIIVDNQGNNTLFTATNFKEISMKYQFKSVILISQFFHLSRTKLIFKKSGITSVTTAHADYFEWRDFYSVLREFPAYYYYLIK